MTEPWRTRPADPTVEGRLAELNALRAAVARVEALRRKWETVDVRLSRRFAANELKRALDGTSG
jgi:ubiquinone biosynthesis protein UbiJ